MRYTYFRITNYKGIREARLGLDPSIGIYTLVGLNESGKTTILAAINSTPTSEKTTPLDDTSDFDPRDLIPLRQSADFTGNIVVRAEIALDEPDLQAMRESLSIKGNIVIESHCALEREFRFERGEFIKEDSGLIRPGIHKVTKQRRIALTAEETKPVVKVFYARVPPILYFPNFLVEIPEKIYVEPTVVLPEPTRTVHAYYRGIMEDVFRAENLDLKIDVLDRMDKDDERTIRQVQAALRRAENNMTKEIIKGWKEILKRDKGPGAVVLDAKKDATGKYIEIRIQRNVDAYRIVERSLGFRWYFAYVLLTHYRLFRAEDRGIVYLFDEPASNLHSSAQRRLLASLADLRTKGGTVIYTTHSQYMIKPEWLEGAHVVRNSGLSYDEEDDEYTANETNITLTPYRRYVHEGGTNTTHIQPIIDALDYRPGPLEFRRDAILVEGKNDYYTLRYLAHLLGEDDPCVIPGMSAGALDPVVSIYVGWGWPFLVLHDGDKEGYIQHERLKAKFEMVSPEQFTLLPDVIGDNKVKAFESLFTAGDRLAIQRAAGRSADKFDKKHFNQSVQELLAREQVVVISDETKGRFKQLFHGLRERLKELG